MNLGLTFQAILASLRLQKKSGRGEQKDMFLRTYAALTTSSPGYSACTACAYGYIIQYILVVFTVLLLLDVPWESGRLGLTAMVGQLLEFALT
jgi:hypothetical protein